MLKLQVAFSVPLDCTSICPANKTHKAGLNFAKFIREANTTPHSAVATGAGPHTRGTFSFSYRQLYHESGCHNHQNVPLMGMPMPMRGTALEQAGGLHCDSSTYLLFLVLDSTFCWHCYCFRPKKGPGEMAQWGRVRNVITRDQGSVSSTHKQSIAACYSSSRGSKVPYLQVHAAYIHTAPPTHIGYILQAYACI